MATNALALKVRGLCTDFHLRTGTLSAVHDLGFELGRGNVLGIVGESGCGKSITARSLLRLIRTPGTSSGSAVFFPVEGSPVDLMRLPPRGPDIRRIRGKKITMIFQEPMNVFSPIHTIGTQIMEALLLHTDLGRRAARRRTLQLLDDVGIPEPGKMIDTYSFQLSGGMAQRASIAMAVSCNPELLIADEPTTALDVSVQAQILRLLKDLQQRRGMSMIFITHDLAVIAQVADRVMVMYLGQMVEEADVEDLFERPLHPYTIKLMASILDPAMERNKQEIEAIEGVVPEPVNLPNRCRFWDRCEEAEARCMSAGMPPVIEAHPGHFVRCLRSAGGA